MNIKIALMFSIMLFTILLSCSHKQLVEKRNKEYESDNDFNNYQFYTNLGIYRFKNNIKNLKIGIINKKSSDYYSSNYDDQSAINFGYSNISGSLFNIKNSWEKLKIDYFSESEKERDKIYKSVLIPPELKEMPVSKNNKYYDSYIDLEKRLFYYISNSKFYSSQSEFEDYLNTRSLSIVDRETLNRILGEQALSQSGLTDEQSKQLQLLKINFLIVFSISSHSQYEDSKGLSGGYIYYSLLNARLIRVETSEVIATMDLIVYY